MNTFYHDIVTTGSGQGTIRTKPTQPGKDGRVEDQSREKIKRLRIERGLSQAKLSAKADVDPSTLSRIERGERTATVPTVRKLALALGVGLAELLSEDSQPES